MNRKSKTIISLIFICFYLFLHAFASQSQDLPKKKEIKQQMKKVADWQLSQKWRKDKIKDGKLIMNRKDWELGAFYPGIVDIYSVTGEKKYLDALKKVAKANKFDRGFNLRNADDQAILQSYLGLYEVVKDPVYLKSTKSTLDSIMMNPQSGAKEYPWSDLLFMGPPIWTHYAKITGQDKYLNYLNKIYWEAVENMLDKEHYLFYRDSRFKTMKAANGKPVFWSRGNGWVFAGLARLLEYMPDNYPDRKKYENLLAQMASTLKKLQQADGFWKSSLMDPAAFPVGETSGTAFFCYGIAWGINNEILDKKEYLPVVEKAWDALSGAIHPDGKLGYVQPGGDRPHTSAYEQSNWYAAGGFLMAGTQMHRLK